MYGICISDHIQVCNIYDRDTCSLKDNVKVGDLEVEIDHGDEYIYIGLYPWNMKSDETYGEFISRVDELVNKFMFQYDIHASIEWHTEVIYC